MRKIKIHIKELECVEYQKFLLSYEYVGWQHATIDDVKLLTHSLCEFLFAKLGYTFSQFVPRGWSGAYLKGDAFETAAHELRIRIIMGESCKYCKTIFHRMSECKKLEHKRRCFFGC